MYYVYVLCSRKDKRLYIGCTDNLDRRIEEHAVGNVESTRDRRPLKLVYYEASLNKYDAFHREKYFKMGYGRRFIKERLKNYLNRPE